MSQIAPKITSQKFHLRLAVDTIAADAKRLDVTIAELKDIHVTVSANIIESATTDLQLTYQIVMPTDSLINRLHWPTWQANKVSFENYLWEETCLECFISGHAPPHDDTNNDIAPYIEINASPDGRYALYQFDSYRNPATLPPNPLLLKEQNTRASIDWSDCMHQSTKPHESGLDTLSPSMSTIASPQRPYCFERSFKLPLTTLSNQQYAIYDTTIKYIHPCVILWLGETPLYFAANHATPPDFHNYHYWSTFDL
ncbi:hypothetical protein [Psychrobacter sp.]|uniref:hypothetical protein n=1 Tax=Psychrobacter sp. TaxID=56811 RepID=UPI0026478D8D|nr:hypothetical protein [Psychrobacter sp.]MDN6276260.1 hypothetical protein [Psychrobacter sp.]MDN6307867.1 hypothetical protein [Psychrobacter sp.]